MSTATADAADTVEAQRYRFAVEPGYCLVGLFAGVRADAAEAVIDGERLVVRFGPWTVDTPLANIADVVVSGPYSVPKTIGPAHLSLRDRGLTFATTSRRGVCISFLEPVRGLEPLGLLRHPGLTATVQDPERFARELRDAVAAVRATEPVDELPEEVTDHLRSLSASQLRSLADEHGVAHRAAMTRDELLELLETAITRGATEAPEPTTDGGPRA